MHRTKALVITGLTLAGAAACGPVSHPSAPSSLKAEASSVAASQSGKTLEKNAAACVKGGGGLLHIIKCFAPKGTLTATVKCVIKDGGKIATPAERNELATVIGPKCASLATK